MSPAGLNRARALAAFSAVVWAASSAVAQADFENLDAGRPLRVQDAYAIERYGWDVQVGPAVSAPASGTSWGLETSVAWGALPRTQLELAAPLLSALSSSGGRTTGLGGLAIGALYDLNVETQSLPAFAVAARVVTPVGSLAPADPRLTLEGIVTRSWAGARLHLNAAATIGPSSASGSAVERSRWFAGAAVDHAWPLRSLLLIGELTAERPLTTRSAVAWSAGAGARWQWTPRLVLDAGLSRRFTGDSPAWGATFGITWSFAVRAFMPVPK